MSGEFVFCPLHDWKISLLTGEVQKPDDGCIQTYEVEVIDGLFIHGNFRKEASSGFLLNKIDEVQL